MKHWLDITQEEYESMSRDEREACIRATMQFEMELMENVIAGTWVRSRYQTIFKLPNCHDFGYTEQ